MNLQTSRMCLLTLSLGLLCTLPVAGQQSASGGAQETTGQDREQRLLDRIEQLERRLAELEQQAQSASPAKADLTSAEYLNEVLVAGPAVAPETATLPATPASPPVPASSPAPQEPEAEPTWSVGPISFSGSVDGYYSWNNNHPASRLNDLYPFVLDTNQFALNLVEIDLEHAPDPIGFRVDFGYGNAMQVSNSLDNDGGFNQYLQQAYVSYQPMSLGGIQFDFGKFVTSAGAEVIESYPNWNYTRSILFAWAIPFYHFGLRTSVPLGSHFTAGFQVVNGWNNVVDNNSGKTVGVTGAFTSGPLSWYGNYYVGPEKTDTNDGLRHLFDTTLLLTPTGWLSAYLNFDYGVEQYVGLPSDKWYGLATAVRLQATDKIAFTPRVEWFWDRNGFATGTIQDLKEITFTTEYKLPAGFLTRFEYRHDWSNAPFFERGTLGPVYQSQDTLTLGIVAFFGPPR